MQIGSMYVLHFDQNKWAASLEFVPSQSSCEVLSKYPFYHIQSHQCRFLYCNLAMGSCENVFKEINMHVSMTNLL